MVNKRDPIPGVHTEETEATTPKGKHLKIFNIACPARRGWGRFPLCKLPPQDLEVRHTG